MKLHLITLLVLKKNFQHCHLWAFFITHICYICVFMLRFHSPKRLWYFSYVKQQIPFIFYLSYGWKALHFTKNGNFFLRLFKICWIMSKDHNCNLCYIFKVEYLPQTVTNQWISITKWPGNNDWYVLFKGETNPSVFPNQSVHVKD